jgi:photosystem II stability/assembly factor-like uncharacterized protein
VPWTQNAGAREGWGLTTSGQLVRSDDGGQRWAAVSRRAATGLARRGVALGMTSGGAVLIADRSAGVWRSPAGSTRVTRVAPGMRPPAQHIGWWSHLSCSGDRAVELSRAFCAAACGGGGVRSIIRQSIDGGRSWRG